MRQFKAAWERFAGDEANLTEFLNAPAPAALIRNSRPQRLFSVDAQHLSPPCLPTSGKVVPATPHWLPEVKYDGYRLIVARDGDRVRLITRGGYDWASRFPWIVEAALKNRHQQFVVDGEAVLLEVDGISDFNGLHSGKHNDAVQLYAFDILALEGEDLRRLPLSMRKPNLARLSRDHPDGILRRQRCRPG